MSTQLFSLEGKIAVVTGGTSGIGRALSLGLAEAGADASVASATATDSDSFARTKLFLVLFIISGHSSYL